MFLEFFSATLPQILSLPSNSQPDRKKKTLCVLICFSIRNRKLYAQPACERRRGKRAAFASAERSKKGCTRGIAALAARKKKTQRMLVASFGTPDRSRTCDLQNRNLTLYPAELRVHARIYSICSRGDCPPFFEKGLQMCPHPRSGLSVICTESVPACSSSSKTISFSRSGSRIAPGR